MDRVSDAASKRQFEGFAAEASDSLLRTGYLMTGDVRDAEDLVQETFLRVGSAVEPGAAETEGYRGRRRRRERNASAAGG